MQVPKRLWMVFAVGFLVAGGIFTYREFRWKRYAVVEPGVLVRSGYLKDWQIQQLAEKEGLKTVFSLTFSQNEQEQKVCDQVGAVRHFHYLAGNGVGPDDPYLKFLEVMNDPSNHPVLVHCSAGVQRTGGAVAIFRILCQGWDFDRAIQEMVAMGNEGDKAQIEQIRKLVDRFRDAKVAGKEPSPGNDAAKR